MDPIALNTTWSRSQRLKRRLLSRVSSRTLDRVNVLEGHTGCVNALSWTRDGELLLSGGDDTTVRIWRLDSSQLEPEYPFVCETVIHTGHRGNIFSAHMLPGSSRIATVAGDRQVRVFDTTGAAGHTRNGRETEYTTSECCIRTFQCHRGRTKRIVTEESPDKFLTVAEDGTVRQHDLRTPHRCRAGGCPAPLVKVPHELSAIGVSPLAPYQFVVAGESPYGYLFDRRQSGRHLWEEWGRTPDEGNMTTCLRRFGRHSRGNGEREGSEHVTGVRMAQSNSHEVLLSYSQDAIYLYSTLDDAELPSRPPSKLPSNPRPSNRMTPAQVARALDDIEMEELDESEGEEGEALFGQVDEEEEEEEEGDDDDDDNEDYEEDEAEDEVEDCYAQIPVIFPRVRFAGACNVRTVKDVNFLGPSDEFVVSGSDDGNFFMWHKPTTGAFGHKTTGAPTTAALAGIYEGDQSVVNVIEQHPYLPLIAVSGIDNSVKLFSTARGDSRFSRVDNAQNITERNAEAAERTASTALDFDLATLLMHHRMIVRAQGGDEDEDAPAGVPCTTQ